MKKILSIWKFPEVVGEVDEEELAKTPIKIAAKIKTIVAHAIEITYIVNFLPAI